MNNYSIFGQKKKRKIPEEEVLGGVQHTGAFRKTVSELFSHVQTEMYASSFK